MKDGSFRARMENDGVEVSIEEGKFGYQITLLKGDLDPGAAQEYYTKMDQIKTVKQDDLVLTDGTKAVESVSHEDTSQSNSRL